MKLYLTKLSKQQKIWFVVALVVIVLVVTIGVILEPGTKSRAGIFTTEMSIKQIAPKLGVTGKALARELGLPIDIPKNKPLKKLAVSQKDLNHSVAHLKSHIPTQLKYYLFFAITFFGVLFLARLGRPDGAEISERKLWYPTAPYIAVLLFTVIVCGFMLGKSPNPMEAIVKVFKSMVGLYPSVFEKVFFFVLFLLMAIVGNKIICGWACPFGAIQELFYRLPILGRVKKHKIPFRLSNAIRATLFVVMLVLLFGIVGNRKGFVVYHSLNPFNLFNWDFDEAAILVTIIATLILALFVYRPFCQLICPFGLISWLAEKVSFMRVRIDSKKCVKCGLCATACPLESMQGKLNDRIFAADCYSCGRCLNVCPQDAIRYKSSWLM